MANNNNKKSKEEILEEMDVAAEIAEKELSKINNIKDVAKWWKSHYLKAGHKRLGRLLLKYA